MARILVVEDEEDILNLIRIRLRKAGHQVAALSRPEDALQVVNQSPPDLVVLDVGLPGMNGLELLEELRGRPGLDDVPAIFLSAHVREEDVEAGRSMEAVYLTKPFVATALLNAVEKILDGREDDASSTDSSDPYG
ncbi:MAG: response regulator [Actinomycetota bacterium]|nr:response regulator [Actinomycetota bacterium]